MDDEWLEILIGLELCNVAKAVCLHGHAALTAHSKIVIGKRGGGEKPTCLMSELYSFTFQCNGITFNFTDTR